jgi:Chaperone of endosialidase
MPFETTLDLLILRRDGVEDSQWPRLSCSQAQQAALAVGDLRLDAGREVLFQDQGQIRAFDDTHRLVFDRGGNLLELHEQGAIRFLTGAPAPSERLRILATGQVGLGTATPTQALEVVGTVKATAFEGDGAGLSGVSGTDVTKVAKAGDTMTGPLTITAAGIGLRITQNATVGGTLTVTGNVGIGTTTPGAPLHVAQYMAVGPFSATTGQGGIDVTGGAAELGFVKRSLTAWPASPVAGDRFVWYNPDGTARLWTHQRGDLLTVTSLGNIGIGMTGPRTQLHVLGRISTGLDFTSAGAVTFFPPDGFAWFHIDNGPSGGRPIGRLRMSYGNSPGDFEVISMLQNGNVGVGRANPAYKLDVAGSAHATSFPTSFDERFKREVRPLTQVLEKLDKIRGISFEWNERYASLGCATGHREIGVIAQEVEAVFPELVTTWGDASYRAIDYGRLTAVLVEAIKQLKAETEALKQRIPAR